MKPELQRLIADAGALSCLVFLLKRLGNGSNDRAVNGLLLKVVDVITNLAH